jgi:hypothetical protein
MNKVITAAVVLCMAGAANAGDARTSHSRSSSMASTTHTVLVGVDIDAALPVGNYGDPTGNYTLNGIGAGALLTVEYPLIEQLSLTGRVGFQFHADKNNTVAGVSVDSHAHSIPVLFGAKYYVLQQDRQGLFAAAEMGMFDLMSSASSGNVSASSNDVKFGIGAGVGYQWKEWSGRVNFHSQDLGNFSNALMLTAGIGYQFAGF